MSIFEKQKRYWFFYATVTLITISVLYTVPIPGNSLFLSAVQNAGHWTLFFVLTLVCCLLVDRSGRSCRIALAVIPAFMMVLGAVGEVIQIPLHRQADWSDIAGNAQGVISGMLAFAFGVFAHRGRFSLAGICLLVALVFAIVNLREPVSQGIALITSPALPVVADFDNPGASLRVRALKGAEIRLVHADNPVLGTSSKALSIVLSGRQFSGVELLEVHRNWSDYGRLKTRIVNTGAASVPLAIRISDRPDDISVTDGYHQLLTLEPGLNVISVNLQSVTQLSSRLLNLDDIHRLSFYSPTTHRSGNTLIVDDVTLE